MALPDYEQRVTPEEDDVASSVFYLVTSTDEGNFPVLVDLESEENPVSIYINERLSEAYLPEVDRLVLGGELMAPVIFQFEDGSIVKHEVTAFDGEEDGSFWNYAERHDEILKMGSRAGKRQEAFMFLNEYYVLRSIEKFGDANASAEATASINRGGDFSERYDLFYDEMNENLQTTMDDFMVGIRDYFKGNSS